MTPPSPDLVEVDVFPELVREGDLLVDAGDDRVTGRPDDAHSTDTHVAIPTATGGWSMQPRGRLARVRRPRTVDQLDAVRDLALTLADQAPTTSAGKRVRDAADRVRKTTP